MKRFKYISCFLFLISINHYANAANRFWVVAASGNWSNSANWSSTSGGIPGVSVPGAADAVIFDNNGIGNCIIDVNAGIISINVSAAYTGTITQGANTITTTGAATFAGGIFTGGSADITIGTAFTLSGTAFTTTSTILEFRNNTAFTGGSFIHNNGSVRYNCAGSITISGISPVFYNLEFVGTGRTYTISSAGNITVLSSLNLSGSLFYTLNTGTIDVSGDINVSNTATGCGGNALINIVGTGVQNYTGSTAAGLGNLPQLAINKSSGSLHLFNYPGVANNFTYSAGTIIPGTSTFCFSRVTSGGYTITGSMSLNNILFTANTGLTATIAAGTTLSVNDLTTAGTANLVLNTGTINVNGNLYLTNTATAGGGSATINIAGTANQTIDATTIIVNQSRLPIVIINKSSGILTLSGNISFSANVTYTAGTIDPTTSTCNIVNNVIITGSFPVYNLAIAAAANVTVTIAAGSILTATNNLSLQSGAFNININTGTIAVQGDIVDNNTGTAGGGNGTILINGTGIQNITSTGIINQGRFPAITINKITGTLVFPSLITVRGNWIYTAGTLDVTTNNSTVVFANTLTITGSHTLNNISFDAAGNYTITVAAAATLTVNGNMATGNINNLTFTGGAINLNGDLNLSNTGIGGGGTTVIAFVGTGNQAITGSLLIDQSRLPAVTVNKTSGTLTFPSLITVRGNWTYITGTIDAATNNSNIIFENTLTITGSHTLYNVTFSGIANYTFTIAAGTIVTLAGDMNITGTSNVTLNTGTLNLNRNLNLTNTAVGGGGTAVIAFVASVNQSIISSLAINQSNLPAININKPAGILTLPSLITVRGNWTYTMSTLDVTTNNSTVVFANTQTIAGTHSLNNVTFEGNANHTYTVSTGSVLTASGSLTTTGASNVILNAPVAGATIIQAQGDIIINNTNAGSGGTGTILINGSAAQAFTSTATAGQGRMPYITIQKTTGILTLTGIISESRNWTYNSGTVDAITNSSTVVFGGNNLTITSAGMNFYNATVTSNTSTLGNNLSVKGNLTINGTGILSAGANTINLDGNWVNRGTAGFTEATSSVNFNGAALQTITSPGGENFTNLTVNNTGAGIRLINNVTTGTTLTMTQGNIDINGNTMILGLSVANRGTLVRSNGTIINTGSFTRWFNTTTIPAASVTGLFPVGTTTDYRPFYVSAPVSGPTTGGTITISYTDATSNTVVSFPDGVFTVVIRKDLNWSMSTANGLAGGTYNLAAEGTGFGAIGNITDLRLTLANSVVGTAGINAGTTANPQINRTGLSLANLTNTFYVGSINLTNSTLPVILISFTATPENGFVKLDWKTTAELNNDHFTIQRSNNTINWEDVKTVEGSANTSTGSSYSAYDENPYSGISYYRLKQTDMDGKQSYSAIRIVDLNNKTAVLNVYPNPAADYINISGATQEKLIVLLFNSNGQRMNIPINNNGSRATLYVSGVVPGIYFIQINQGNSNEVRKITIVK